MIEYISDARAQVRDVNNIYCRASLLSSVPHMGPTEVSKVVAIFFICRMQGIARSIFREKHKRHWSCTSVRSLWERGAQVFKFRSQAVRDKITYLMWPYNWMVNVPDFKTYLISWYDILRSKRNWYTFPTSCKHFSTDEPRMSVPVCLEMQQV